MRHERPGVYSAYDASAVVSAGAAPKSIGVAARAAGGTVGEAVTLTSYAAGVRAFGEDTEAGMCTILKLLFQNGASTVTAVRVADEGTLTDYEAAFAVLEGREAHCEYDGVEPVATADGRYCYVPVTHKVTLGEIVDLLQAFKAQPVTLLVGILYIIARSAGKYFGASWSCRLTGQPKTITDHLGITLLPQAGVALGMAITAATLPDGALARNVVLFSVLVYELVGPALTKRSLLAVGEIKPEGRTSARQENKA